MKEIRLKISEIFGDQPHTSSILMNKLCRSIGTQRGNYGNEVERILTLSLGNSWDSILGLLGYNGVSRFDAKPLTILFPVKQNISRIKTEINTGRIV